MNPQEFNDRRNFQINIIRNAEHQHKVFAPTCDELRLEISRRHDEIRRRELADEQFPETINRARAEINRLDRLSAHRIVGLPNGVDPSTRALRRITKLRAEIDALEKDLES